MPKLDGRVLVHGSFQLRQKVLDERPEWQPGAVCDPQNFVWTTYAPRIPKGLMLNPEWEVSTTAALMAQATEGKLGECFVRPDSGNKPFGGTVFSGDRVLWPAMTRMFVRYGGDIPIIVCPLKSIQAEYRLIVVHGTVVAGSRYILDDCLDLAPEYPAAAVRVAEEAAQHWSPGPAFVVDVAQTPKGYLVVEMNAFSTADWYGADVLAVLLAAERI